MEDEEDPTDQEMVQNIISSPRMVDFFLGLAREQGRAVCNGCGRTFLLKDLDEHKECVTCQNYQYEEHDGWSSGDS